MVTRKCDIKNARRGKFAKEYALWNNMFHRCYNESSLKRRPTYRGCYVCDRWFTFSNFLEDLPKIPGYSLWKNNTISRKFSLDKDRRVPGNKVYSLDTVCFISTSDNTILSNKNMDYKSIGLKECRKVKATNLFTGEVKIFSSRKECAKAIGSTPDTVGKAVNNHFHGKNILKGYKLEDYKDN